MIFTLVMKATYYRLKLISLVPRRSGRGEEENLGTGDLCDNIGLVGVSTKWSYVTASPSHHDQAIMTSCRIYINNFAS